MGVPRFLAVIAVTGLLVVGCATDASEPVEVVHSIAEPWQPTPFGVDQATLTAADRVCRDMDPPAGAPLVLIDVRGGSKALVVYAGPKDELDCMADFSWTNGPIANGASGSSSSDPFPKPALGTLANVTSATGGGVADTSTVVGQAGTGVAAVEVTLIDGARIRASLAPSGWFGAWWTGDRRYTSLTAFDATGQATWSGQ